MSGGTAPKLVVTLPVAWAVGYYLVQRLLSWLGTREECAALSTWLLPCRRLHKTVCLLPFFSGGLAWACGRRDCSAIIAATCCAVGGYFGSRTFCSTLAYLSDEGTVELTNYSSQWIDLSGLQCVRDLTFKNPIEPLERWILNILSLQSLQWVTFQYEAGQHRLDRVTRGLMTLLAGHDQLDLDIRFVDPHSHIHFLGNSLTLSQINLSKELISAIPNTMPSVILKGYCLQPLTTHMWSGLLNRERFNTQSCRWQSSTELISVMRENDQLTICGGEPIDALIEAIPPNLTVALEDCILDHFTKKHFERLLMKSTDLDVQGRLNGEPFRLTRKRDKLTVTKSTVCDNLVLALSSERLLQATWLGYEYFEDCNIRWIEVKWVGCDLIQISADNFIHFLGMNDLVVENCRFGNSKPFTLHRQGSQITILGGDLINKLVDGIPEKLPLQLNDCNLRYLDRAAFKQLFGMKNLRAENCMLSNLGKPLTFVRQDNQLTISGGRLSYELFMAIPEGVLVLLNQCDLTDLGEEGLDRLWDMRGLTVDRCRYWHEKDHRYLTITLSKWKLTIVGQSSVLTTEPSLTAELVRAIPQRFAFELTHCNLRIKDREFAKWLLSMGDLVAENCLFNKSTPCRIRRQGDRLTISGGQLARDLIAAIPEGVQIQLTGCDLESWHFKSLLTRTNDLVAEDCRLGGSTPCSLEWKNGALTIWDGTLSGELFRSIPESVPVQVDNYDLTHLGQKGLVRVWGMPGLTIARSLYRNEHDSKKYLTITLSEGKLTIVGQSSKYTTEPWLTAKLVSAIRKGFAVEIQDVQLHGLLRWQFHYLLSRMTSVRMRNCSICGYSESFDLTCEGNRLSIMGKPPKDSLLRAAYLNTDLIKAIPQEFLVKLTYCNLLSDDIEGTKRLLYVDDLVAKQCYFGESKPFNLTRKDRTLTITGGHACHLKSSFITAIPVGSVTDLILDTVHLYCHLEETCNHLMSIKSLQLKNCWDLFYNRSITLMCNSKKTVISDSKPPDALVAAISSKCPVELHKCDLSHCSQETLDHLLSMRDLVAENCLFKASNPRSIRRQGEKLTISGGRLSNDLIAAIPRGVTEIHVNDLALPLSQQNYKKLLSVERFKATNCLDRVHDKRLSIDWVRDRHIQNWSTLTMVGGVVSSELIRLAFYSTAVKLTDCDFGLLAGREFGQILKARSLVAENCVRDSLPVAIKWVDNVLVIDGVDTMDSHLLTVVLGRYPEEVQYRDGQESFTLTRQSKQLTFCVKQIHPYLLRGIGRWCQPEFTLWKIVVRSETSPSGRYCDAVINAARSIPSLEMQADDNQNFSVTQNRGVMRVVGAKITNTIEWDGYRELIMENSEIVDTPALAHVLYRHMRRSSNLKRKPIKFVMKNCRYLDRSITVTSVKSGAISLSGLQVTEELTEALYQSHAREIEFVNCTDIGRVAGLFRPTQYRANRVRNRRRALSFVNCRLTQELVGAITPFYPHIYLKRCSLAQLDLTQLVSKELTLEGCELGQSIQFSSQLETLHLDSRYRNDPTLAQALLGLENLTVNYLNRH